MRNINLKTSFRRILNEPLYSFLNITAFTLSMAIAFLLILIIYNQFNFDIHNSNRERIFRVNTTLINSEHGSTRYATTPTIIKNLIDTNFFSEYVNLVPISVGIKGGANELLTAHGYTVDGDYFSLFQIPLIKGDLKSVLSEPSKVAISTELSKKLFNDSDVIGREISIDRLGDFMISGVYDLSLNKSHLSNDILFSALDNRNLIAKGLVDSNLYANENYASSYLYVLSPGSSSVTQVNDVLISTGKTLKTKLFADNLKFELTFFGLPLSKISPNKGLWLDNSRSLSYDSILIFIAIILVLLSLTLFNYTSIMTSLGLAKSREIGIRKILGASKKQIVFQYISESVIISSISFLLGILLIPFISRFSAFQSITAGLKYDGWIYLILFGFSLLVGLIAGLIPALSVLKFKELDMLHNVFRNTIFKGFSFRKIIIISQFTVSMVLIIFGYTLIKQTSFMVDADYGFDYTNTLSVKVSNQREFNLIRDEFSKLTEVTGVSFISTNLGYMPTDFKKVWAKDPSHNVDLSIYYIDEHSIKDLGLTLIDGNNFSNNAAVNKSSIILNQKALDALGVSEDRGVGINMNDSTIYRIQGTVKDFHFQNFKRAIAPMAFIYFSEPDGFVNLKIKHGKINFVKERLESTVFQAEIGRKLEPFKWDEVYNELQSHGDSISMIIYLTVTLILIGCLGLIAVVSFATQQRFKEVTIRKVIGANYFQIFKVLTKEYILLLTISLIIGAAIGYFVSMEFIKEYAYRITLDVLFFSVPMLLFSMLCMSILLLTTWKTCKGKPIDNLKEN